MANINLNSESKAATAYFKTKLIEYLPETIKIANEVAQQLPYTNYIFSYLTSTVKSMIADIPSSISLSGISASDIDDIINYLESQTSSTKFRIFNESKLKKYEKLKYFTVLRELIDQVCKIYKFIICLHYLFKVRCMIDNTKKKLEMQIPVSIVNNVVELFNTIICLINPILTKIQYAVDNIKQNKPYTAKLKEQSKRIVDEILQPELLNKLMGKQDMNTYAIPISSVTADDPNIQVDSINLPQINYNLNKNALNRTVGLTTIDIYNIVKASHNLPVKFPKLSRTSLSNQFMIYMRNASVFKLYVEYIIKAPYMQSGDVINWDSITIDPKYIIHENANGQDEDIQLLEDIIFSVPLPRYVFVDDLTAVTFAVNAIIDVEYRGDLAELYADVKRAQTEFESSNIDSTITPIRYYIVPASIGVYTNSYISEVGYNISGGHKVSVLFDLENKQFMFYEPMSVKDQQITLANGIYINGVNYCLYNLFHNSGKYVYFRNYGVVNLNLDANLQLQEHVVAGRSDKLIINIRRKYIYENKIIRDYYKDNNELYEEFANKNRDFAFGYCGLWNYLLAFLLMINPNHTVYNIFYMLDQIFHTEEYAFNFTKALIRSFANHIENMLDCKIEYIPLVIITKDALTNIRIQTGPTRPPGTVIEYITNRIEYVKRESPQLTAYEDSMIPLDTYFSNQEIEYLKTQKHKKGQKHDMVPSYAIWPIFKDIVSSLAQSINFKKRCAIKHANTANTLYANYTTGKEKLIMFVNMTWPDEEPETPENNTTNNTPNQ